MKYHFVIAVLFFSFSLFSQQKGVSPINQQSTTNNQQTYAVVVGISDYQDEGIPDLRFADKDAEAFAGFLQSPAGGSLDEDHLKILLNEEATVAQFAIALDWLMEVATEKDKVIIYFSGHGDVERRTLTQPGFLLCWDAPARVYMAGGALALPMLQEVISTISIQNKSKVIVVTDACRSGKLSGSTVGGAQITGSNLAKQYANEIKILSCQPNEYSIEGEQWGGGRGAFSYHLLDGLYGMADGNADNSVNLLELGRYLEDNVTTEVAPQSQIPMTVGSRGEKLTDVFPEILARLKESKASGMQMFTATETRGIEDDVLAAADTNIVEMYLAFKESISKKAFLEPAKACADFYYDKLSAEPQLAKLHSSMRRNYAAALQDDAQQILNTRLKSGLTQSVLRAVNPQEYYKNYPRYLDRAADLLGRDHYMYNTLQSRKHFFEGILNKERQEKLASYRKASSIEPNMAHAMAEMIMLFDSEQKDSADYYFKKVTELVPNWLEPYINISKYYEGVLKDGTKAEAFLLKALTIDTNSLIIQFNLATHYSRQKKFEQSEALFKKLVSEDKGDICFPCLYNDFALLYLKNRDYEKALPVMLKAVELDSNNVTVLTSLSAIYGNLGRVNDAIDVLHRAIKIDSTNAGFYNNLGSAYSYIGKTEKALEYFLKGHELNPDDDYINFNLATIYQRMGELDRAMAKLDELIEKDPEATDYLNLYGLIYKQKGEDDLAMQTFRKIISIDNAYGPAYVNLGELLFKKEKTAEAIDTLNIVFTTKVLYAHPYAHLHLGAHYLDVDSLEKAEYHLESILSQNPILLGNKLLIAQLRIKQGKLEEAEEIILAALEQNPNDAALFAVYALYELENNNIDKAMQHLEKSFELGFNQINDFKEDESLQPLRDHPQWKVLMAKYFPDQDKK